MGRALSQGPEAQVTLDMGVGVGVGTVPGSLQENLSPFRGNPDSWYDGNAIETLDGPLSRPLRPFTRDFEFSGESGFLVGGRKKRERKLTGFPG